MAALRALGLGMVFDDGVQVLSGIDLAVADGEFVTLLGPSGCGKTTLLKAFAGFHRPTSGRIEIGGIDVTHAPPEARDTAMCFQSYALFPHLTVAQNIDFGPRQMRVAPAERQKRLSELLEQVALTPHRAKLPDRLSGGQQQRVALARALAIRPRVVLFDEPLSNLDARLRDQVRREIRALQREAGFTAIYVTHDQAEALAMSDRVVVMQAGRIEQIGTPEAIYRYPATVFVADFVGASNLVRLRSAAGTSVQTDLGPLQLAGPVPAGATHVGWRPEDATLEDGAGTGVNILAGTVVSRAFQGAFTEVYLALDVGPGRAPGPVEVRLHLHGPAPALGDRLRFRVPPARLHPVMERPA